MILIDLHEPSQVENLIKQSVKVKRMGLNQLGQADYFWTSIDGHSIQVERKQIDELLGDISGTEEQLSREINEADETLLFYEGTFAPMASMKTSVQTWRPKGNVMVPNRHYNISYTGVQAWFSQIDKCGITVVHTFDYLCTASTLVALYANSQKQEHTTLRRYIKGKIHVEDKNPHVISLMGIKNGGVGEVIAKALIARFGTMYYTLSQDMEVLADTNIEDDSGRVRKVGTARAKRLLKAIGR